MLPHGFLVYSDIPSSFGTISVTLHLGPAGRNTEGFLSAARANITESAPASSACADSLILVLMKCTHWSRSVYVPNWTNHFHPHYKSLAIPSFSLDQQCRPISPTWPSHQAACPSFDNVQSSFGSRSVLCGIRGQVWMVEWATFGSCTRWVEVCCPGVYGGF